MSVNWDAVAALGQVAGALAAAAAAWIALRTTRGVRRDRLEDIRERRRDAVQETLLRLQVLSRNQLTCAREIEMELRGLLICYSAMTVKDQNELPAIRAMVRMDPSAATAPTTAPEAVNEALLQLGILRGRPEP